MGNNCRERVHGQTTWSIGSVEPAKNRRVNQKLTSLARRLLAVRLGQVKLGVNGGLR